MVARAIMVCASLRASSSGSLALGASQLAVTCGRFRILQPLADPLLTLVQHPDDPLEQESVQQVQQQQEVDDLEDELRNVDPEGVEELHRPRLRRREDQDQRDDQAVDADGLGERQAQDVGNEDRARRLRVATQRLHGLAEADAQADAGADGSDHGEAGREIGVPLDQILLSCACVSQASSRLACVQAVAGSWVSA